MVSGTQLLENYRKKCGKQKSYLAEKCGICRATFISKWKNPTTFTLLQTKVLCEELAIPIEDMMVIFFGKKVN